MSTMLREMTEAMDRYIESIVYVGDEPVEKWDESQVVRGKTTPESTPGSFAPKLQGPQKITVESWEYKRPGVRHQNKLDVLFNPRSKQELLRWADEGAKSLRYMQWGDNTVFWSAYEALHQQVHAALGGLRYLSDRDSKTLMTAIVQGADAVNGEADSGEAKIADLVHSTLYDDLFPGIRKSWLRTLRETIADWTHWRR